MVVVVMVVLVLVLVCCWGAAMVFPKKIARTDNKATSSRSMASLPHSGVTRPSSCHRTCQIMASLLSLAGGGRLLGSLATEAQVDLVRAGTEQQNLCVTSQLNCSCHNVSTVFSHRLGLSNGKLFGPS